MKAGYSKNPLERKLGLKVHFNCHLMNAPQHYTEWFNTLDLELNTVHEAEAESLDFVHLFVTSEAELDAYYGQCKAWLKKDGMLWISWPKKSGSIKADINSNHVRLYGLQNGLVDVKVAAIDEDWSGLKFVYRLKDRT